MIDKCSHCGSQKYVKDGKAAGKQRYECKECGRKFGGGKHSLSEKLFAMQLYVNNVGIRKIGFFCKVSHSLVIKWIRSTYKNLSSKIEREGKAEGREPDVIEMDEIYTYIKKNKSGCQYGLLIVGDKSALLNLK